jgi:hypothetical protein
MSDLTEYDVMRDVAASSLESAISSLDASAEALKRLIESKRLPTGERLGDLRGLAIEIQHRSDWIAGCLCV